MPSLTTLIDDKSPLILYDSTWLPGTSTDDGLASLYYLGTFTTNNVTNGAVSFDFNGTAIWIYGAQRTNHGSYTVQVDSQTYSGYNGEANNLFQQSLFNLSSLSQGTHSVKLTNTATGSLYVDIDMIVWESEVGNPGDQLVLETVQDTDPRFSYQGSAWSTSSDSLNFNMFSNGTGHATGTNDATVTFTFTGMLIACEAVTLYGTSGPYNGPYSVQLDGSSTVTYNATTAAPINYGSVIYHADNLGSGSHQIVLTNLPAVSSQPLLSIDYAQLWTTSSSSGSSTSPGSSDSVSSNGSQHISTAAIAGLAVAVAAAVAGLVAAIFFYRRWRALLPIHDGYKIGTPQPPPELSAVATAGLTGTNRSLLRSGSSAQALSEWTQQPGDGREGRHDEATILSSSLRDSRYNSYAGDTSTRFSLDEGLGHRPLPDAPGGGLSLAAEFPKLAGAASPRRGWSITDTGSVATSDVPPNYSQVIRSTTGPRI